VRYDRIVKHAMVLAALVSAFPVFAAHPQTYLVSVEGIQLGAKEYVDSFSIDTWGVEIVATCKIPPGWTINAGSSADPTGKIAGEASLGVTYLDRNRLKYLRQFVLLRTGEPVRKRAFRRGNVNLPASFRGTVDIGTYGPSEKTRKQILDFRNLRLSPASRCPLPRH
jgi:hypothetical protein